MTDQSMMAAQTDDILKCCACAQLLMDPLTLQCLHTYCSTCVKSIEITTREDSAGLTCAHCHLFTPQHDVRVVPMIIQLLDSLSATKRSTTETKCDQCGSEVAKWYCSDCKTEASLCDKCKGFHDKFVKHQVLTVAQLNEDYYTLDKPMYCAKHEKKEVEVFCADCEELMCELCEGLLHGGHVTETVHGALQRLRGLVTADITHLETCVAHNQEAINTAEKAKTEIEQPYDADQRKLDEKLEADIAKLREEHKENSAELRAKKQAVLKNFDDDMQDIMSKVSEERQVLAWLKVTVARTSGVTLLQQLLGGLLKRVNHVTSDCGYGDSKSGFRVYASRCWPWFLPDAESGSEDSKVTLKVKQCIDLDDDGFRRPFTRIAIMWDRIWIIHRDMYLVYRFSLDGTRVDSVKLGTDIDTPMNMIQNGRHEGILISGSGLYTLDEQCQIRTRIGQGDYCDACVAADGSLYALSRYDDRVARFKRSNGAWQKHNAITLEGYYDDIRYTDSDDPSNTIHVTDTRIFVCLKDNRRINCYDKTGRKIQVYRSDSKGADVYAHPSVCGMDASGALLVANSDNQTLDRCHLFYFEVLPNFVLR